MQWSDEDLCVSQMSVHYAIHTLVLCCCCNIIVRYVSAADVSQLMTAAAKAAPTRSIDDILRDDYEYTTDLTSAGRYMPLLRRSARALVRYKDKLNAARQRVLQVLLVHTCTSPRPHDCLL